MGTTAAQQLGGTSGTSAYVIGIPLDFAAFLVHLSLSHVAGIWAL